MLKRMHFVLAGLLGAVLGAGCHGGHVSMHVNGHTPHRMHHVDRSHVCTRHCHNHYYDGSRVVVVSNHRHGSSCGHRWDGAHWVVVRHVPGPGPVVHVCRRDCHHHYYDGDRLIVISGHHHGRSCGHAWDRNRWVLVRHTPGRHHDQPVRHHDRPARHHDRHDRAVHVCTRGCHHHYYDGGRLIALNGHHHRAGCGHRWDGAHWVVAHVGKARRHSDRPTYQDHAPSHKVRKTKKARRKH